MNYEQTEIYKTLKRRNVILGNYDDVIKYHLESNFDDIEDLRRIVNNLPTEPDIGKFWLVYEIIIHYNKVLHHYFKSLDELTENEFKLMQEINKVNRNKKDEFNKNEKLQMIRYFINIFNYFYVNKDKIIEELS